MIKIVHCELHQFSVIHECTVNFTILVRVHYSLTQYMCTYGGLHFPLVETPPPSL